MKRSKTVHTLESLMARTVEVGDCLEWTGYFQNGSPFVVSGGVKWLVRRLIRHLEGQVLSSGVHMGTHCDNQKCIKSEHLAERSKTRHMSMIARKVDYQHPLRISKLQKAAESRRVLSDENLNLIRLDTRSCAAIANDFGVSKSLIANIRRGKSRKVVNASINPFAGLMR
jgi:hypothetical protein